MGQRAVGLGELEHRLLCQLAPKPVTPALCSQGGRTSNTVLRQRCGGGWSPGPGTALAPSSLPKFV